MAGRISQSTIEQIRAASDIVEVIGSYFPLKRAGSSVSFAGDSASEYDRLIEERKQRRAAAAAADVIEDRRLRREAAASQPPKQKPGWNASTKPARRL